MPNDQFYLKHNVKLEPLFTQWYAWSYLIPPATAAMNLVNEAVTLKDLRSRTKELALTLMGKNPTVLRAAKTAYRRVRDMSYDDANDYLMSKNDQARLFDPEQGREKGLKQFLDEKSYRPGLGGYKRDT